MNFLAKKQFREIEEYAISKGINLIEKATDNIVNIIKKRFDKKSRVLVIVGGGNNGSDGIATAIKLINKGYEVDLYQIDKKNNGINKGYYHEFCKIKQPLQTLPKISNYNVIIDGLFGIGVNRSLSNDMVEFIGDINKYSKYIIAIDVPSGLNAFNAKVYGAAIKANETITFLADKQGLYTGDGPDHTGIVLVVELINKRNIKFSNSDYKVYKNHIDDINIDKIRREKKNTNKGSYGNLALIGGNEGMHGSLYLAAKSALYSGCGKISMVPLDKDFCIDMDLAELMTKSLVYIHQHLNSFSALVVGIGFATTQVSEEILKKIIMNASQPIVFDADALNIIAKNLEIREKFIQLKHKVITPHPAEAARLLNCSIQEVQNDRFEAVRKLAKKYSATVVLKGNGSLICKDNEVYINTTGNQGMAVAGQGDVLSGVIGAFLAQALDILSAARLAVYVHGLAGDNIANELGGYIGVFPSKVAKEVCNVLNKL